MNGVFDEIFIIILGVRDDIVGLFCFCDGLWELLIWFKFFDVVIVEFIKWNCCWVSNFCCFLMDVMFIVMILIVE